MFSIDRGSLAEQAGFKVGDQIMEVNGKSFENLKHKEAVGFIKSQKHIMVTLKVIFTSISLTFKLSVHLYNRDSLIVVVIKAFHRMIGFYMFIYFIIHISSMPFYLICYQ